MKQKKKNPAKISQTFLTHLKGLYHKSFSGS